MTDLGELSWCLRIQVAQCQDSVRLTQGTFILKMFESTTRAGKGGRSGNSTNAQKKPKSSASRSSASSISLLLGMKPTWHICQKSKTFDSTAQTNHWSWLMSCRFRCPSSDHRVHVFMVHHNGLSFLWVKQLQNALVYFYKTNRDMCSNWDLLTGRSSPDVSLIIK